MTYSRQGLTLLELLQQLSIGEVATGTNGDRFVMNATRDLLYESDRSPVLINEEIFNLRYSILTEDCKMVSTEEDCITHALKQSNETIARLIQEKEQLRLRVRTLNEALADVGQLSSNAIEDEWLGDLHD